ncbi:MAG: nucleoside triphosphate pyrophosphatase [Marinobacter sp.]|uniref:Maf family protein n=1 Tax=Marinobacter sp. TaxID=50741 RepID=UPI00299DC370|nr:nucleoside triphosphate pyrophosphatase [Marinobacter sp.]MDX1757135.1 nucleoside triphosphate pyrophosphatase [Marinobacter sp.]
MPATPLVLASSSPYRRELLSRLGIPFEHASPDIDESPHPNESAQRLTVRLAAEKARALASQFPNHWIIGSDQVATLADGSILTKPGTHELASDQLARCSGQTVRFMTGLALLDSTDGQLATLCEPFEVQFRTLSDGDIEHYLRTDTPYDCAGSFRMEGLGIALFSGLAGRDPNSLIGLPLIGLCELLRAWGLDPLEAAYRNSNRD